MSQIIGVLKDDTADVFDYVRKKDGGTRDLGVIMQALLRHPHFQGTEKHG